MLRTLLTALSLAITLQSLAAAENHFPAEGARLHYRIIRFRVPGMVDGGNYTLEIARGVHYDTGTFSKNVVVEKKQGGVAVVAEVPLFGSEYTWRLYTSGGGRGDLFHFSTLSNPLTDSFFTLSVGRSSGSLSASYVFLDCSRALHDMRGNVVWFLPAKTENPTMPGGIQDLKVTARGTITYLMGPKMYETSYDGSFLKEISDSGSAPNVKGLIHHEGTRMANGHYMVLGYETLHWKVVGKKVRIKRNADSAGGYEPRNFGVVTELNEKGRPVWQYSAADYIIHSDLINRRMPDGSPTFDEHLNAFFFDSVNSCVYLGYRNINRILKVSYPGGKVQREYGVRYDAKGLPEGEGIFCHQHAMAVRQDSLYLFNNNGCSDRSIPKIQIMVEDNDVPCGMKTVWEYALSPVVMSVGRSSGGNIVLLPGGDVFASLSLPYNDLVIVSRDKTEKWRATPMYRQTVDRPWQSINNYRGSVVSSSEMLHMLTSGVSK